jgi:hypothetical protein
MVRRCLDIEAAGARLGVMSDVPGADKTYAILALLMASPRGTNVVVVPQNIFTQWTDAIRRFCGDRLKWAPYVTYADVSALLHDRSALRRLDAVITTPLYYDLVAGCLAGVRVARVLIDEVDSVEFFLRRGRVECDTLWLVSASFRPEVAERLGLPFRPEHECRCEPSFVAEGFRELDDAPLRTRTVCGNVYVDRILNGLFDEAQQGALNALDFSAGGALPQLATSERHAVELLMGDLVGGMVARASAIERYRHVLATRDDLEPHEVAGLNRSIAEDGEKLEAMRARHALVLGRIADNALCSICYEPMEGNKAVVACCNNAFCWDCLSAWCAHSASLRTRDGASCPYCRADLGREWASRVVRIEAAAGAEPAAFGEPRPQRGESKLDALLDMFRIDGAVGLKVIIFSDNGRVFDKVGELLSGLGIRCAELNGGTIAAIDRDVGGYTRGDTRVLMCNSGLYGCGANLEMTSDVIFLHRTKPHMYEQVVGRAQRPGRATRLRVHELLHENELELDQAEQA